MSNHSVRLCLDCRYRLDYLTGSECPECGRPFDLNDPATYFTPSPLGAVKRVLTPLQPLIVHAIIGFICAFLLAHLMFSLLPLSAYVGALAAMLVAAITIPSIRNKVRLVLLLYYITWLIVFTVGMWAAMSGNRNHFEFLFDWATNPAMNATSFLLQRRVPYFA